MTTRCAPLLLLCLASCDRGLEVDETAPGPIEDLRITGATRDSLSLAWTAPGDDGLADGESAEQVVIYYSEQPITDSRLEQATRAEMTLLPGTAGVAQDAVVSGLREDALYYVALEAVDDVGNRALSNVVSGQTLDLSAPEPVAALSAEVVSTASIFLK